jgi:UDP-4-amino-4,6-dideoxy-N-acetyl-beta-L-altrosamine transaminase
MRTVIPYGRQSIAEEDIEAVVQVLRSGFLTQGKQVPLFERAVCEHVGANHAVAVNSATSALHIACLALGLGEGDWLWTSPITFVASANCGRYCGAQVDFVDIDSQSYNLSPQALEEKLIQAQKSGRLPKVVVPVHLCGQSCDMESIYRLGQQYGFSIIEDASHAIGGSYQGHAIGCGQYSDITVFSFHPVKIVTTGEGGMAVTNRKELADKMRRLRDHGITRNVDEMTQSPDGPWYYQQLELGFNYRMTDIQAALGCSQLKKLDRFIEQRNSIADIYHRALSAMEITTPHVYPECRSAYHLYVVCLDHKRSAISHRQLFEQMREEGVGVNLHYIPVHTQPYYQQQGFSFGDFPVAEKYYQEAVTLPIYPALTESEQQKVISVLQEVLR